VSASESQPLVNGLTEAQAWFFGWMRQGGQNHENLFAAFDRFEEQTRRDNEVAPPLDCSMELPQMKAELEAAMQDMYSGAITTKMCSDVRRILASVLGVFSCSFSGL
jgi:hypothetical protein